MTEIPVPTVVIKWRLVVSFIVKMSLDSTEAFLSLSLDFVLNDQTTFTYSISKYTHSFTKRNGASCVYLLLLQVSWLQHSHSAKWISFRNKSLQKIISYHNAAVCYIPSHQLLLK